MRGTMNLYGTSGSSAPLEVSQPLSWLHMVPYLFVKSTFKFANSPATHRYTMSDLWELKLRG